MKPRVLLVCYYFPPFYITGSVIRTVKYIKFLKDRVDFYVITSKHYDREIKDSFGEIIKDVTVEYVDDPVRKLFHGQVKGHIPQAKASGGKTKMSLRFKIKEWIKSSFIPDYFVTWAFHAKKVILEKYKNEKFDAVYATFPEASALLLGRMLSRKLKIPLVLDYRDLWSTNPNPVVKKSFPLNIISCFIEKWVIRGASQMIFATDFARKNYQSRGFIGQKSCSVLWNGFDPDDLPVFNELKKESECFEIVYAGIIGSVSSPARNPKYLFDAIKKLRDEKINVKLQIYGQMNEDVKVYIKDNRMDYVICHEEVSHQVIMQIINKADCACVILTRIEDLSAVPGKVYEYIGLNKPILALTEKESQLAEILSQYHDSQVASPTQVDSIAEAIRVLMSKKNINQSQFEARNLFDRRQTAEKLLAIIKTCQTVAAV